jgi:dTDP-glucose pyrophosphorylase/predicted transcriptional regulator
MINKIKKNQLKNIFLSTYSKIKHAAYIIKKSKYKIALVIQDKKLIGTITNGDIRRNLLRGLDLDDPVKIIANKKPVVIIKKTNISKIEKIMREKKILSIPHINRFGNILGLYNKKIKKNLKNATDVIIMAGGKGKRLWPLTKNCPKPMLKISGKPMLEKLIVKTRSYGYRNFIISLNYLPEVIKSFFKNGKKWNINILYIKEKKPLGTAGVLSLLDNKISENFVLMNCDVVTSLNIHDLEQYHIKNNAFITIGAHIKKLEIQYGILKTNGINLKSFHEKPVLNHNINAGIYVFNKMILKILEKNNYYDIPEVIKIAMKRKKKVIVYPIYETWKDIGLFQEFKNIRNK